MASILSRLSEASATSLMRSGRLSRPTKPGSRLGLSLKPNLVAITTCPRNGASASPNECFVLERTIDLSSVEECNAAFDGRPKEGDHLVPVSGRAIANAHSHT